jgi:hypothetical protein
MASVASQPPIRTPSGGTTDQVFQPLADCGNGNPAFYHQYFDEFDQAFSFTSGNTYNITLNSGTLAQTPGVGGLALFTTSAVSGTGIVEIQLVTASFTVNIAPKKLFFETAITTVSAPATTSIIAGLITNPNTTPFTAVADGVYFKWVGGTGLTINSAVGGVVTSVTIPAAAYTFAATGQPLGLAFYITRLGDVLAYVDTQLVGFIPQSNIGTTGNPQNAGAVARITGPTLTSINLTPTLAVQTNSAAPKTVTFDFLDVQQER